jgi:cytoskeletal protein CcmA (bactofilin family)
MGKNPKTDQGDSENTMDSKATPQYNASPSYQSQPSVEPPPYRPVAEQQPQQQSSPTSSSSPRAVTESESLARDIKEGTLSGFVGNGTVLTGEATFKAMLRVDGHLSGRVSSEAGTLIVGNNGQVDADIQVAVAVIHGTVNGDIIASQRLELGRAAKVNGNIQTPSLVIEQGAVFEGSCRMAQLKTAQEKREDKPRDNKAREEAALAESIPAGGESVAAPGDFSSMSSEVAS